jgi:hypothetical protein
MEVAHAAQMLAQRVAHSNFYKKIRTSGLMIQGA